MIKTSLSFANAVISPKREDLQTIHAADKNIAIYQRDTSLLRQELDQVLEQPIACELTGTSQEILAKLHDAFRQSRLHFPLLLEDVSDLLLLFKQYTKASSFRLLLATVRTDMCRKFHTDINDLRMLCTYVGQGTLWLPDEAIDQKATSAGKPDRPVVVDERHIQQVDTGDVVILKGALYGNAAPIMHRSPSISANGEQRYLLRIDTNEFLNF